MKKEQFVAKITELQAFLAKQADEASSKIDPHNSYKDYYEGAHRAYEIAVCAVSDIFATELAEDEADKIEETMKLKNFRPVKTREVEYFGVTIRIPAHCEWVTTDDDGYVYAWVGTPDEQHGVWVFADDTGIEIPVFIGEFDPIDENDAIKTMRHYPLAGEQS